MEKENKILSEIRALRIVERRKRFWVMEATKGWWGVTKNAKEHWCYKELHVELHNRLTLISMSMNSNNHHFTILTTKPIVFLLEIHDVAFSN